MFLRRLEYLTALARERHFGRAADPDNPYANMAIVGAERAERDIDSLAKKYLGQDVYPVSPRGEWRTISLIEPTHVWYRS